MPAHARGWTVMHRKGKHLSNYCSFIHMKSLVIAKSEQRNNTLCSVHAAKSKRNLESEKFFVKTFLEILFSSWIHNDYEVDGKVTIPSSLKYFFLLFISEKVVPFCVSCVLMKEFWCQAVVSPYCRRPRAFSPTEASSDYILTFLPSNSEHSAAASSSTSRNRFAIIFFSFYVLLCPDSVFWSEITQKFFDTQRWHDGCICEWTSSDMEKFWEEENWADGNGIVNLEHFYVWNRQPPGNQ